MTTTPDEAWQALADGNERFRAGAAEHPRQDQARRADVARGQAPIAAVLACSDSRVAPEVVLDQGLGDLFVVRNAGQVVTDGDVASLEYAVAELSVPLVVVVGHERCGAVQAAIDATRPDAAPVPPLIARHLAPIAPAVEAVRERSGATDPDDVGQEHLERTLSGLLATSELLSAAVADGSLVIVGARYSLSDGRLERRAAVGLSAR